MPEKQSISSIFRRIRAGSNLCLNRKMTAVLAKKVSFAGLFAVMAGFTPLCGGEAAKLFNAPPRDAKLQVWYHWAGSYVTKPGITADIEAMKKAGIGAVHCFIVSQAWLPAGEKPFSPEWFELIRHLAAEADKNGLELGFHNCGGWSSSGGPWVKPENAMKMLTFSELRIADDKATHLLPEPNVNGGFYRDVAVVAFPVSPEIKLAESRINGSEVAGGAGKLLDNAKDKAVVEVAFERPLAPSDSLRLNFQGRSIQLELNLEISENGRDYRQFRRVFFRDNANTPGWKTVRLNGLPENIRYFRLIFTHAPIRSWIKFVPQRLDGVSATSLSVIEDVENRNSAKTQFFYHPVKGKAAAEAGITASEVADISGRLKPDGTLEWKRPDGREYLVLRVGYTLTGAKNLPAQGGMLGLECDKLSRSGIESHFPEYLGRMIETAKPFGGVKYGHIDSYEVGGQNWTENFDLEFARRRGYELKKYFPALAGYTVGNAGESAKFLFDFQRTVADLFAENYYKRFAELCRENGLRCGIEAYGGPFDNQQCGSFADIPADEFWIRKKSDYKISRLALSTANVYGKKYVAAEAFTAMPDVGRWMLTLSQLREYSEFAWAAGINQLILHSYVHQPFMNVKPGVSLGGFGSHFNRNSTWWDFVPLWTDSVARAQALLQNGTPLRDILIFTGDGHPRSMPYSKDLYESGYAFDFCNPTALRDVIKVLPGGEIAASGKVRYRMLYCANPYPSVASLKKLRELCNGGAVIAGVRPIESPSLADSREEFDALVRELWDSGKIRTEKNDFAAASAAGIRPFWKSEQKGLRGQIRQIGNDRVFFLWNTTEKDFDSEVGFASDLSYAEYFDHISGTVSPAEIVSRKDGYAFIRIKLPPKRAVFVVFSPEPASKDGSVSTAAAPSTLPLNGEWKVTFEDGPGRINGETVFPELSSLSENTNPAIRYYSGKTLYTKTFNVDKSYFKPGVSPVLQLGKVYDLAQVELNGKIIGTAWNAPFELKLGSALKAGENTLKIRVVNTWPNRMIGDEKENPPEKYSGPCPKWVLEDRADSGSGRYTWSNFRPWKKTDKLFPAGLLGPVTISFR